MRARLSHFETSARVAPSMPEPNSNLMDDVAEVAAFRPVPRTGVIYVTVEAQKRVSASTRRGGATSGKVSLTPASFPARPIA